MLKLLLTSKARRNPLLMPLIAAAVAVLVTIAVGEPPSPEDKQPTPETPSVGPPPPEGVEILSPGIAPLPPGFVEIAPDPPGVVEVPPEITPNEKREEAKSPPPEDSLGWWGEPILSGDDEQGMVLLLIWLFALALVGLAVLGAWHVWCGFQPSIKAAIAVITKFSPAAWKRFLIAIAVAIFAVYVWPTQWKGLPKDGKFAQRENRFTGEVQWLWKAYNEKYHTWRRH
jgi:hypothetical protein